MIYYSKKVSEKLRKLSGNNYYVVADFDRTLTVPDDKTKSSWGVLAESGIMPKKYKADRMELYNTYRPIEIDYSLNPKVKDKFMKEWWKKHIGLFVEYKLSKDVFETVNKNSHTFEYRKGVKELLATLNKKDIPFIVLSAGLGDLIKENLKNNGLLYKNVHLLSNFVKFKNNIAAGIKGKVIHPLNKDCTVLPKKVQAAIAGTTNVFLFGDNIEDIKMVNPNGLNVISVGFCDAGNEPNLNLFKSTFDIVCTNLTSFEELLTAIKKKFNFCF